MVVAAEGRNHHVGGRPKAAPLIDWQPVLISTGHGLLVSTCRGLLISTDGLINLDALISLCRVLKTLRNRFIQLTATMNPMGNQWGGQDTQVG